MGKCLFKYGHSTITMVNLKQVMGSMFQTFINILFSKKPGDSHNAMMHEKQHAWLNNLHRFGEPAIVHDGANANICSKLHDCEFDCYLDNHAEEFWQFFDLKSK
jgi:hypothetical protein